MKRLQLVAHVFTNALARRRQELSLLEREEALRQSYAEITLLKERLQAESDYLKAEIRVIHPHGEITGQSAVIRQVMHLVEQVAPTGSSVLVLRRDRHRQGTRRPGHPPAQPAPGTA